MLAFLSRAGLGLLRRYRNTMLLVAIGLLLLPNLPSSGPLPIRGLTQGGSRLWVVLDLGFTELHFQPAEIAKVLFVAFLAAYLADRQAALTGAHRRLGPIRIPEPRQLVPLVAVWAGSLLILIYQRDLGASLLLFLTFAALLYAATGAAGYLVAGGLLAAGGGLAAWRLFDHVQRRVQAWLDPFADYADTGYQVAQGLFALGTGSLSGSGPGLGRPDLIPNAETDFIFAAVGEELGLAGSIAVLCCFALFLAAGFGIALRSRDRFRTLLAAGLTFVIGLQTFLIIGGVLRVLPLTGITLPFMSYGGSALIGLLAGAVGPGQPGGALVNGPIRRLAMAMFLCFTVLVGAVTWIRPFAEPPVRPRNARWHRPGKERGVIVAATERFWPSRCRTRTTSCANRETCWVCVRTWSATSLIVGDGGLEAPTSTNWQPS